MNQESPMRVLLSDENMQEKMRSWRVPGAEPCVFTSILLPILPKPNVFSFVLSKSAAQAAIHWPTARPNRARTTANKGFGNTLIEMIVKTPGSASEQGPDLVISHVFMSLNGF